MLELTGIHLPLDAGAPGADARPYLVQAAARALSLPNEAVSDVRVLRRSIDARKKADVHFTATLAVGLADAAVEEALVACGAEKAHVPYEPLWLEPWPVGAPRPVVVGTGPAGLFAALYLAQAGARPLVIERGAAVEQRSRAVRTFDGGGPLDLAANIQFGEGGAGAFSDGKLTTNTKNPRIAHVLHWFVEAGAPEDILWEAHPHIGSDRLPRTVATMRERIIALGGEVRFLTQLTGLELLDGALRAVELTDVRTGSSEQVPVRQLILATGHSARDTLSLLADEGFALVRKPFSIGVRIEHLQERINRAQWGEAAAHPALGAAEYKMVAHLKDAKGRHDRNVYTFCMCPGGSVVCAASEEGGVVTNGMSDYARDGANANAALLVDVSPDDFAGTDPLVGVRFQRDIEQRAFAVVRECGGNPYQAPAQTVGAFLGKSGKSMPIAESAVKPSYARGVVECDLHEVLPSFAADAIARALPSFDRKLHGFADGQAVMTAPETRSSCPVRLLRGSDMQAFRAASADVDVVCAGETGIYPCGEGAGYAGGIMSAAVDGLRIAEAVVGTASA